LSDYKLLEKLDEFLAEEEKEFVKRDYFYVSEVGKSKKEIYESLKGLKKKAKTEGRLKRIFDNGDYMHRRFYNYFLQMGILVACEVKAVNNDLFHGYADAVISDEKDLWVIDLKSCSQWTFNKLQEAEWNHKLQLMLYMYYLNIAKGKVVYECKDNQSVKEFDIMLDKELIEKVIEEYKQLKDNINNNVIPADTPIMIEEIKIHGV
jgi:hypothetical protein